MNPEVEQILKEISASPATRLIILSIPIFFILITVELIINQLKKTNFYRFTDGATNISCGIGSQVIGLFLKFFTVVLYVMLYLKSPFKGMISNSWWVFIVLFIAVDFAYYWFHRMAHEINVLWGSHVVHHQSEEYNLTVALRQGWIQSIFSSCFYFPLAILGFDPITFVMINSLQTLYQFWIHTKFIHKMPPWFEYVFNTPSHHRVHHGVNPKYIDKNHGGTLIIFDRMFGTFQDEEEEVVYGITKQPKSWNPLWLNLEHWIDVFKDVAKARSFSDGCKILFYPPGWKPTYLGGVDPPKEVTPQAFKKYETHISPSLNYYVFFQFILVLLGSGLFLNLSVTMPLNMKIVGTLLIIFSVVNIGAIFESKPYVFYIELLRIAILSGSIIFLMIEHPWFIPLVTITLLLTLISFIWFISQKNQFSLQRS